MQFLISYKQFAICNIRICNRAGGHEHEHWAWHGHGHAHGHGYRALGQEHGYGHEIFIYYN